MMLLFTFSLWKKICSYFKPPSVEAATIEVENKNPTTNNNNVEASETEEVKESIKKNKVGFRDR